MKDTGQRYQYLKNEKKNEWTFFIRNNWLTKRNYTNKPLKRKDEKIQWENENVKLSSFHSALSKKGCKHFEGCILFTKHYSWVVTLPPMSAHTHQIFLCSFWGLFSKIKLSSGKNLFSLLLSFAQSLHFPPYRINVFSMLSWTDSFSI